jgi:phosphopantetheinyl transferase
MLQLLDAALRCNRAFLRLGAASEDRGPGVAETALLRALPVDRRSLAFLARWTRKEAFIKALGLGLRPRQRSFFFTLWKAVTSPN